MQSACSMLSSVAYLALQYCSTLSNKRQNFRERRRWPYNVCFDFLYNFCLQHFSFPEELNKMWSKIYVGLHLKLRLFSSYFNETWFLSTEFQKPLKYQISWRSVHWELSCYMGVYRRKDRHDEANSRFPQFAKAHTNQQNALCVRTDSWLSSLGLWKLPDNGPAGAKHLASWLKTRVAYCHVCFVAYFFLRFFSRSHEKCLLASSCPSVVSLCPSVCPHVSALLLLRDFPEICYLRLLWKACGENPYFLKIGQKYQSLTWIRSYCLFLLRS